MTLDDWDKQLENVAQRLIKEGEDYLRAATSKNPHQPIYHYTSAESALKILKSDQLFFTERAHQNDPSEMRFWHRSGGASCTRTRRSRDC